MPAAATINATFSLIGGGSLGGSLDLSAPSDAVQIGLGNFDTLERSLTWGTGSNNIKEWFHDERSILTTANDDLDLAGGLTNPLGTTITFTTIKFLLVCIDAPDGSKNLRVGPQNVSNGWQGPWGGVGATVYETVYDWTFFYNPYTGYAVTAGTGDILRIHNPTGGTVTYRIWIGGMV